MTLQTGLLVVIQGLPASVFRGVLIHMKYVATRPREEREEKLKALIVQMKAEIAEAKDKAARR